MFQQERLRLVPFTLDFKLRLTATMIIDFGWCWMIEKFTKNLFGDFRPKDIALRRPDQDRAEEQRKKLEAEEKQRAKEQGLLTAKA